MNLCSSLALYSDGFGHDSDTWEYDLTLPSINTQQNTFQCYTNPRLGSDCSYYSSDNLEGDRQPIMYTFDGFQPEPLPPSLDEQQVPQVNCPSLNSDELDDNQFYQPELPGNSSLFQSDWPGDILASSDMDSNHENDWSMPTFDSDPDFVEDVQQEEVEKMAYDNPNDTKTAIDLSFGDQGLIGSVDAYAQALDPDTSAEKYYHSREKLKINVLEESTIQVPPPPSPLSPTSPPSSSTLLCQIPLENRQDHFSQTVPRSREWLMGRQEGMLADLLSTMCEGEPKLTLAARVSRRCIVYDKKNGVIRRKTEVAGPGKSKDLSRKTISLKKKSWHVAASIIRAVDLVHNSLSQDVISTKRDIFYRDIPTFRCQARVDAIVEDLACTFQTPRSCLNVIATSRSEVYGSIRFTLKAAGHTLGSMGVGGSEVSTVSCDRIDHAGGRGISRTDFNTLVSIPVIESEVLRIEIHPQTRYVLVIEKEATLSHLISVGFCESHGPCILLTSKGYPDRVSRRLLKCIADMVRYGVYFLDRPFGLDPPHLKAPSPSSVPLHIPLLAVVDCDPNGFDIYLTYRCGSAKCAYDNENLAVSTLQLLGQLPSDWTMLFRDCSLLEISGKQDKENNDSKQRKYLKNQFSRSLLPLTHRDRSLLLKRLTQHPFVKTDKTTKAELSRMLRMNCKSELQSLYLDINDGRDDSESSESPLNTKRLAFVSYLQHKLQLKFL